MTGPVTPIALLVIALLGIVLGFVLGSFWWFLLSLVASIAAGVLLYRGRAALTGTPGTTDRPERAPDGDGTPPARAAAEPEPGPDTADGAPGSAAAVATRPEVWVVDGRPRYHRAGCELIADSTAEAIPLDQAVEDGFEACPLCAPAHLPVG